MIFFRDQDLTPAQFMAFAQRFGQPVEYPFIKGLPGFPEITPVVKLEHETVNFGGVWHSDTTYLERPPMGTMLIAREVPPAGGDTLFANQYLAYESLSPRMREVLGRLTAISSSAKADVTRSREDRVKTDGREDARKDYTAEHPVVRTHPETGRKALYVNAGHTVRFKNMTEEESAPLLEFLSRAPDQARVHLPVQLGRGIDRVLGQPRRAALPGQRLPRPPARHAPHHAGGRRPLKRWTVNRQIVRT